MSGLESMVEERGYAAVLEELTGLVSREHNKRLPPEGTTPPELIPFNALQGLLTAALSHAREVDAVVRPTGEHD